MTSTRRNTGLWWAVALALSIGCAGGARVSGGGSADAVSATDADADTDADSDADSDGDSDADDPCAAAGTSCYDGPAGTDGVGPCIAGTLACVDGVLACEGSVGPSEETCNGVDDDCDGTVDGPSAAAPCLTGEQGECAIGELTCDAGAEVCLGPAPVEETCANPGADDDCDGSVDDVPGLGDACDTGIGGVCATGESQCVDAELACIAQVGAGDRVEACANGVDDDCDGDTDELECTSIGCADGTREAFLDTDAYPDVAGCAGGWDRPGVYVVEAPTCARGAGDDSENPDGAGCGVEDLCAEGWHVCTDPADLEASSPDGCAGAADADAAFFVQRTSGPGCGQCATGDDAGCTGASCRGTCAPNPDTTNDLFGCGTIGSAPAASCVPLDRTSGNGCASLGAPWSCGGGAGGGIVVVAAIASSEDEALNVVKTRADGGGVLCCKD